MRTRALLPLLALGLGLGALAATAAPAVEKGEKPDADRIAKLIAQLGSDDFDEREKASADLEAVGDPAYGALREAARNTDEEVHKRAEILIGKIEKRRESAEALKPKHVHLIYKDTPLSEAIEDFKKQTGYNITLNDPENKLKDRKITLDTGDATFWQAMDQFCDKAGLQEADVTANGLAAPIGPVPVRVPRPIFRPGVINPAPVPPAANGPALQVAAPPQAVPPPPPPLGIVVAPGFQPGAAPPAGADAVVLSDGKADPLPTDASSAVRVQALPKADQFGPAPDGEILIGLRLSIEPRLLLQSVDKVKVGKAIDDQKQELTQIDAEAAPAGGIPAGAAAVGRIGARGLGGVVIMPFPGPGMSIGAGSLQQDTVVHLKKGDKASKSLSEWSGTIGAHILTEATPVITADDILKVKSGATFKGGENGQLTIADVAKNPNGQVTIRVQLQPPTDSVPAGGGNPINVPRRGRGVGAWNMQGAAGLALLDDKGHVIKEVGNQMQNQVTVVNGVATVTQSLYLTFQPEKDQAPAKLVYNARKVLSVDVPFTLKDVPLP